MEGIGLRRDGQGRHKLSVASERSENLWGIGVITEATRSYAEQDARSQYI